MATHGVLLLLLLSHGGSSGFVVRSDDAGEGMRVSLLLAPRTTSPKASTEAPTSPDQPNVGTADAAPAKADPHVEQDMVEATETSDPAASPPSSAEGAPAAATAAGTALTPPQAKPSTYDPWSQAGYLPNTPPALILDLWPKVEPCWRGGGSVTPLRLRLKLDSSGNLLATEILDTDKRRALSVEQLKIEAMAKAAAACSPYVELGSATDFQVVVPPTWVRR